MSSNRTDVSDEDDDVQGHGLYFVKRGSIGRNQVPMTRGFARGFDDFDGDGIELVDAQKPADLAQESFDEAEVHGGVPGQQPGGGRPGRPVRPVRGRRVPGRRPRRPRGWWRSCR